MKDTKNLEELNKYDVAIVGGKGALLGEIAEDIKPRDLEQVDMVVTAGLGRDDNNFLAEYKENNPNGVIVAINKDQPKYLGEGDKLLKGDLQDIVLQLEMELGRRNENN